jgi:F0F1-type ATP synthase delta subunit
MGENMQDILWKVIVPIAAIHAVVLAAIVVVIRRLLLSDTLRAVERINQVEADVRKKEESLRRDIEEREKEIAQRKAEADEELQRQRDQMAREMAQIKERMTAEARKESDRIVDQAHRNEEKLRQQLTLETEQKAVEYAGRLMGLVFSEKVTAKLDEVFVEELLDALDEMDASGLTVEASTSEFTAAHPLAPAQRERLQRIRTDKFGTKIRVQEQIREDLLAGLILKLGSLEIDGSLLNRFREAGEEAKKGAAV